MENAVGKTKNRSIGRTALFRIKHPRACAYEEARRDRINAYLSRGSGLSHSLRSTPFSPSYPELRPWIRSLANGNVGIVFSHR